MTIVVPVPIPPAGLPLPDPGDRATFSTRKLEQLRWANNEYSTGSKALADASYSNALDSQVSAASAAVSKSAVDTNTALVAGYAGASPWASGTYGLGAVVWSPANRRLYRKTTASSATVLDPSADPANWGLISAEQPFEAVTTQVKAAVAGGCYSLQNVTPQAADTNLCLWSNNAENAVWFKSGATITPTCRTGVDGTLSMSKVTESATNAEHSLASTSATITPLGEYTASAYVAAGERQFVEFRFQSNNGSFGAIISRFNLTTGAVLTGGAASSATYIGSTCVYQGNGIYLISVTGTLSATTTLAFLYLYGIQSSGGATTYLGDGSSGYFVGSGQIEAGTVATSRIPTQATAVTRASGVVAPQRVVLPATPASNDVVSVNVANGIDKNVIDPNGKSICDTFGPMTLDNKNATVDLQFIRNSWRLV